MIAKASDKLQVDNDLKMLELWESTWLEFNVKKCKVLHTSFNNNPYNTYHLNRKVMLTSDQEKDLGVLTTCNLLWNNQINSCVNKANQMTCFIARNLISKEKSLMLRIYKTLIRPNLNTAFSCATQFMNMGTGPYYLGSKGFSDDLLG